MEKRLNNELKWIRDAPRGKRGHSKARVRSYEALLEATEASRDSERVQTGAIAIAAGARLGNRVVSAEGVSKAYGEKRLFSNMNFDLPPGCIMGVIGPNGVGKTSLLRMIAQVRETAPLQVIAQCGYWWCRYCSRCLEEPLLPLLPLPTAFLLLATGIYTFTFTGGGARRGRGAGGFHRGARVRQPDAPRP